MRESLKSANWIKTGKQDWKARDEIIWKKGMAGTMNERATLRLQQSMAITKKEEEEINKEDLGIMMVGKDTNVLCCHGKGACRRCEMILLRAVRTLAGLGAGIWAEHGGSSQGEQEHQTD